MRIIKHGDQYELGEKTCANCKCVFVYNGKDVKETYDKDNECDINYVVCPECHNWVYI